MKKTEEKFWNISKCEEENTAEMLLYGDISSYDYFDEECVTTKKFNEELEALGEVDTINVRINSPGGDVFTASAIYTRLKECKATINVKIDGLCASAATMIAMAGDTVRISEAGLFMVHDPLCLLFDYYNETELSKVITRLSTVKQSILNCYKAKTGKDEAELHALMQAETWMSAEDAVAQGFCDELMQSENVDDRLCIASLALKPEKYKNFPKQLVSMTVGQKDKKPKKQEEQDMPEDKNAYNEAIAQERERMKAIDECTLPGFEAMAKEAKYEKPITAAEFAMQVIAEQKKQSKQYLQDRETDVNNSGATNVTPVSVEDVAGTTDSDPYGDMIDKLFPQK